MTQMGNTAILFFFLVLNTYGNLTKNKPGDASVKTFTINNVQQFNATLAKIKPGDDIVFKNGTYKDLIFNFKANGEEGKPITFHAETPGGVIFNGKSQIFIEGNWLVISGFKFEDITD